jgi:hypothetical protein
MLKTDLMQDTITPGVIKPNPWAVAGYGGGNWPDYPALCHLFPQAHHMLIYIHPSEGVHGDTMDGEKGDATVEEVAAWLPHAQPPNLELPAGYTSASNVEKMVDLTISHGLKREKFFVFSAHYNYIPHICGVTMNCGYPKADFTQFSDHEWGLNIDGSMVPTVGIFRNTVKPPAPLDPHHYLWFASSTKGAHGLPGGPFHLIGRTLDERAVVQAYDKLRYPHPHLHESELGKLRDECHALAMRINTTAHEQSHHGIVPWDDFRRFGWREQQLLHRSEGRLLVA